MIDFSADHDNLKTYADVKAIKMKDPGTSRYRYLLHLFFMLTLPIGLAKSTDSTSFWKQKAVIDGKNYVGKLLFTDIPALSEITVCLDIFYRNNAYSTAFSYCVRNEKIPEISLSRHINKLEIRILGKLYNVHTVLNQNIWHTVCLMWKEQTNLLEVYVNETRVFSATTEQRKIMGNGSLVLGAQHTSSRGQIQINASTTMSGDIYNYQMWNYTRSQEKLLNCMEGNLISWTKEDWDFRKLSKDVQLRCAANAAVTPPPTTSTTTLTTTLGATTSTRTPAPEISVVTESFPVATESLTSVTITPGIFVTSVTQKETSSSNSRENSTSKQPSTLPSSPSGESGLSTKVSTTESLPGNDLLTNSSINLPTGINASTTGNISTYHSPPGLRTTSAVPISSWESTTTIQQTPTDAKTTPDPQVVSTTKTTTIFTQPDKISEPIIGTTQVVITSPTTTVITPSRSSSATKSSTEIHSTSNVVTPSSQPPTTPPTTLSRGTESLVSQSGTTNITSATGNKPNKVTFYFVQITFTNSSMDAIDEDIASGFIHSMMDQLFNNTDFAAVGVTVSDTASPPEYIAKAVVRANSSKAQELLAYDLKKLLVEGFADPELNPELTTQIVTADGLGAKYCRTGSTWYENFQYEWPKTIATEKATLQCHTNPNEMATRECYISVTNLETDWGEANYSKCIPSSFNDLENVPVTPENANYLAMQILNMTKTATSLLDNDIRIILNKISEIIALGEIDSENAKVHIDVINTILLRAGTSISPFTNKILNLMEEVGFKMNFSSETANVTTDSMALLISKTFGELYFTVTTYLEGNLEITLEQLPVDKAVASIHLPKSIQNQAEISSSKVQFNFIGTSSPFQGSEPSGHVLTTYVISASFEGKAINDLKDPVDITLWHFQENVWNFPVECAFWDFTKNNNMGGWNTLGCALKSTSKEYTSCSCNHLTHFGVLLDITRAPLDPLNDHILTLLTYVGCGFASLFIGLALVTYGMFKQLRRDYPSKILMNLCFSLLMLNLVFLVNEWLSSFRITGLCIFVGAILHYFLLTSFTWMGLEAVHMYFAFVKVFNSYIHKYILKLCIAGWGIPLVVVAALLSANVHFYGDMYEDKKLENPAVFCWIRNDTVFYTAVVCYFGLIFFLNISMFIVVLVQIKTLKSTRTKDWKTLFLHDIKSTLSLGLLLGLTWGFIFLAWGPVRVAFSYLFVIFNTLLGFFIFVFHCLIKENVRKHWRMYLCCGRCRIDNYSDWSRLSNGDARYNGRIHVSPCDSYESTRSNNTASTSNASSLSSFSRDTFYGGSHVNGGGIFINPAHRASYHANVYPDSWRVSWLQTCNETD
ncbi:adhesion G-protein coupled receptor G4 isoform X1 [Ranitomeya imitator]|uniref:adhesion G-protein coupled receptor G4 isoform X1 n=1 Tax=Ranitomeya imitator TaxID=111125 RepID=UPI0037E94E54